MYPHIGELLGSIPVRSYGLLSTCGLIFGAILAYRAGITAGLDRRRLIDCMFWVLIGSIFGAKFLVIIINFPSFLETPWTWIDLGLTVLRVPSIVVVWRGGLVYFGGVIAGLFAGFWFCRRQKLEFAQFADAIIPALSLGHVWGRFGCFLAGCCFGKAGGGPLGATFVEGSQAFELHASQGTLPPPYSTTHALHPVQLYEALGELVIAGALIFFVVSHRRKPGQVTLTYLSCYSALRFFLELYRGDRVRGYIGDPVSLVSFNRLIGIDGGSPTFLTVSQTISVIVLLVCLWLTVVLSSKKH